MNYVLLLSVEVLQVSLSEHRKEEHVVALTTNESDPNCMIMAERGYHVDA